MGGGGGSVCVGGNICHNDAEFWTDMSGQTVSLFAILTALLCGKKFMTNTAVFLMSNFLGFLL